MNASIERIVDAAHAHGLEIRQLHDDDYMMQCPVHEPDNNPSVHVVYRPGDGCTVICDQHDSADRRLTLQILRKLGLDYPDLYDHPQTSRDAARKNHERLWKRLTPDELRTLADKQPAEPDREGEPLAEPERFALPTPCVPESERGALSDQFSAICERLEVRATFGLIAATCPVCGEVEALRVLYAPLQHATVLRCKSCGGGSEYAGKIASALQITPACLCSNGSEVMVYDDPHGVVYEYADGLTVSRSPSKQIRQHGRTKGRHPLWLADRVGEHAKAGAPIFFVEGEKDAATLWACGYPATTAPGGGGNLMKVLDFESVKATLSGADVIAVMDKDVTGAKWRSQMEAVLRSVVKSLTVVQTAGQAHDTTDACMMCEGLELLEIVGRQPSKVDAADGEDDDDSGAEDMERFERFWLETPWLTEVRDAARQSLAAPWAVLMALLARVSTALPPYVVVPAFVGASPASLNLFVALVGPSGKGKGAAESVAVRLMPDIRGAETAQPGSGEGIVTMFCERVADESGSERDDHGRRTILRCVNVRALLSIPEVKALGAVMARQGSTLAGELTKAWSGEPLGAHTKYATGTFLAPRYGYRFGLVTGVQEGNAGILFDEAETGLPQRFLWAYTQDDPAYAIAYEQWRRRADVEPLVDVSRFPEDLETVQALYRLGDRWNMIDHGSAYPLAEIAYPEEARRETFEERRRNLVGEAGDRLDAHGNLLRLKVAALLPWLDPERADPYTVDENDWRLAGEILAYSQVTRRHCMEAERDSQRERAASHAKLKQSAAREARDEQEELREGAPGKILQFLTAKGRRGQPFTGKQIRNGVRPKWRPFVYTALADMAKTEPPEVTCTQAGDTISGSKWCVPVSS